MHNQSHKLLLALSHPRSNTMQSLSGSQKYPKPRCWLTISQSIAYIFDFCFVMDRRVSLGASGVSTHPSGFWNTSAMYDGIG